jgi:hypothetical protein
MSKHTPGPWQSSRDATPDWHHQATLYSADTDERVAVVFGEANEALIAAAPDLLAECRDAAAWLAEHEPYMGREVSEGYAAIIDGLRAAIAKATGGEA